jgi:Protein of unknown function (DUF2905)
LCPRIVVWEGNALWRRRFVASEASVAAHGFSGEIVVRGRNFTLYVPVGLMVALSLVPTIVLNVVERK